MTTETTTDLRDTYTVRAPGSASWASGLPSLAAAGRALAAARDSGVDARVYDDEARADVTAEAIEAALDERNSIGDLEIRALQVEAGAAGDASMVELCQRALDEGRGSHADEACVDVILDERSRAGR